MNTDKTMKTVKDLLQEIINKADIKNFWRLLKIIKEVGDHEQQISLQIPSSFYYLLTQKGMGNREEIVEILISIGTNISEEDKNILIPPKQSIYYVVECHPSERHCHDCGESYYYTTKEQAIKCQKYLDKEHCPFYCQRHDIEESDGRYIGLSTEINPFVPLDNNNDDFDYEKMKTKKELEETLKEEYKEELTRGWEVNTTTYEFKQCKCLYPKKCDCKSIFCVETTAPNKPDYVSSDEEEPNIFNDNYDNLTEEELSSLHLISQSTISFTMYDYALRGDIIGTVQRRMERSRDE